MGEFLDRGSYVQFVSGAPTIQLLAAVSSSEILGRAVVSLEMVSNSVVVKVHSPEPGNDLE